MKKKHLIASLTFILFCSYSFIANCQDMLTDKDKQILLILARQTLYFYIAEGKQITINPEYITENIKKPLSCFVTLEKKYTGLRGCIGMFQSPYPLYENVISRTIAASTQDPRFPPVKPEELKDIMIEISVLTEPKLLSCSSVEDLLEKLRPNIDGVILETPYGTSTFLPQVWEQLPDKESFLNHLCLKHGAPASTWKDKFEEIKVFTYQAIVFNEQEYGRITVGSKGAKVGPKGAWLIDPLAGKGKIALQPGIELKPGTVLTSDSDIIIQE